MRYHVHRSVMQFNLRHSVIATEPPFLPRNFTCNIQLAMYFFFYYISRLT